MLLSLIKPLRIAPVKKWFSIQKRRKYKNIVKGNIYDGFSVREDLYRFHRENVIEGKVSMFVLIRFENGEINKTLF